ncbi:hypothetical protein [Myxococcus sp. CA040A]|uniref:hypothetical protein n=1 Tax=Myxococcus sp. CA040A TaxID=2741738 RepID=UPI00157A92C6|nr:hypothetical protein [Myxococcus sp. CA040A]NTX01760.1 hypothetical protein [Myxococcus sp. CA040A]
MRAWLAVLTGTLFLALLAPGCDDDDNKPAPNGEDSGVPGDPDGGGHPGDGGPSPDFACNVARQEGCGTGQSCHFADLGSGRTGSRCFAAACDVVQQNCAQGQRCTYVSAGATTERRCVEAGASAEGARCTLAPTDGGVEYDTCAAGLFCKDERQDDGGTGFFCRRLCHATTQCGDAGECNTVLRLAGTSELPLLCGPRSQACDPFAQGCTAPLSCYPASSGPVCAGSGTRGTGETCDFSNQCAPGSACVNTGRGLNCRPLCRPSGTPACTAGTCRPLNDNPGVGACIP